MNQERLLKVLVGPIISEKATFIADKANQYAFVVLPDATKTEVKAAVELCFKREVTSVQILTIKENEYVLAARTIGTKPSRILRKHILPNCLSVIIISVALQVPSAIFTESYLSFLGLGVSQPMPSLGSLANEARGALQSYPYQLVFPAVMICLIVLSLNLLGDGLRDAFDPKLRR